MPLFCFTMQSPFFLSLRYLAYIYLKYIYLKRPFVISRKILLIYIKTLLSMHNLTEGLKLSLYTYLFDGYATLVARSMHLHIIISGVGRGGGLENQLFSIIELSRQRIRLVSIRPGIPRYLPEFEKLYFARGGPGDPFGKRRILSGASGPTWSR